VHVQRERMTCKFWLRRVALARNDGFNAAELNGIRRLVLDAHGVILEAWNEHCGTRA